MTYYQVCEYYFLISLKGSTMEDNNEWSYGHIFKETEATGRIHTEAITEKPAKENTDLVYKNVPVSSHGDMDLDALLGAKTYNFTKSITYLNLSRTKTIYVQEATGSIHAVYPVSNIYHYSKEEKNPPNLFLAVEELTYGCISSARESLRMLKESLYDNDLSFYSGDLKALYSKLDAEVTRLSKLIKHGYHTENSVKVRLYRSIPLFDIDKESSIYLSNLGVVVSTKPNISDYKHPWCSQRKKLAPDYEGGYLLSVEIVDNSNTLEDRYINVLGKQKRVVGAKDPDRPCGLYIKEYEGSTLTNERTVPLESKLLDGEGLHRTKEKAHMHKDLCEPSEFMLKDNRAKNTLGIVRDTTDASGSILKAVTAAAILAKTFRKYPTGSL